MNRIREQRAKERIEQLTAELADHSRRYHVDDAPIISDAAYDKLFIELVELEHSYPQYRQSHSVSNRRGDMLKSSLENVKHSLPLYSLDNVFSQEFVQLFATQCSEVGVIAMNDMEFCTEPKMDGLALNLQYNNGLLSRAITRGNGEEGEDVTANAIMVRNIPIKLTGDDVPTFLEVRGEVIMRHEIFERNNRQLVATNQKPFVNPRNAAAGSLRQGDAKVTAQRGLEFYAYGVGAFSSASSDIKRAMPNTQFASLVRLEDMGFHVNEHTERHTSVQGVIDYIRKIETLRPDLPYDIDGVVIKLNKVLHQKLLGFNNRAPKWAIAYKYPAEEENTVVEDILFSVGRTGLVTPVALVTPTFVGGVTISNVNLHNFAEIRRLGLMIGDTVAVKRAGDVIPKITAVVANVRPATARDIVIPTCCPVCSTPLVKDREDKGQSYCPGGAKCAAQRLETILHFAQRDAMDIRELGEQTVRRFLDTGLIKDPSDLYKLTVQDILILSGFKKTSANRLYHNIQQSKFPLLHRFIFALGIRDVGEVTAKALANAFGSIEELAKASLVRLLDVDGVGSKTAQTIHRFFRDEETSQLLANYLANGIVPSTIDVPRANTSSGAKMQKHLPFEGMSFCVTGSFQYGSRSKIKEQMEQLGAKFHTAVSHRTEILIAGEKPGIKMLEAQRYGTEIWSAGMFEEKIVNAQRSQP